MIRLLYAASSAMRLGRLPDAKSVAVPADAWPLAAQNAGLKAYIHAMIVLRSAGRRPIRMSHGGFHRHNRA